MTLVALVAIIALAAGGLIVVMFAIAHVERIDDASPPVSEETPEAATARAQKLPRRPAWHGMRQTWTSWWHRHANDPPNSRARRYRRAVFKERAGWLAAVAALSVVLAYLIAQI